MFHPRRPLGIILLRHSNIMEKRRPLSGITYSWTLRLIALSAVASLNKLSDLAAPALSLTDPRRDRVRCLLYALHGLLVTPTWTPLPAGTGALLVTARLWDVIHTVHGAGGNGSSAGVSHRDPYFPCLRTCFGSQPSAIPAGSFP